MVRFSVRVTTQRVLRHQLDASLRRSADGRVLSGGDPPRVVTLTARGTAVLDAALAGAPAEHPSARDLIERLVRGGILHPVATPSEPVPGLVTLIVPVHNGEAWLAALLAGTPSEVDVIVVDDGSTDRSAEIARSFGVRVLESKASRGAAATRNRGLEEATSPLVAFVDHDCVQSDEWVWRLVTLFEDPQLAVAAPRVRSVVGTSALERYERVASPLDMGPRPAMVAAGRRVPYVPSAALVARREALVQVGGFDSRLPIGEDVDLVWRLAAAGWSIRYAPECEVEHHPRPDVRSMYRQRVQYGRSAVLLEKLHPGDVAPVRSTPITAALWTFIALGRPRAALTAFAAATLPAASGVRGPVPRAHAVSLAGRGQLGGARYLARAVTREWLPVVAAACLGSRRARRATLVAFAWDVLAAATGEPRSVRLSFPLIRAIDSASHASGLWRAARAERSASALLPRPVRRRRAAPPDNLN